MEAEKADKPKRKSKRSSAETVVARNLLAYALIRRSTVLLLVAVVCALVSVTAAIKIFSMAPPPRFIQLTADGRVLPMIPLTEPNAESGEVIRFAVDSVKWINTYDYVNWRDQIQAQSDRFSSKGWRSYMDGLEASSTLAAVREKRMVVTSNAIGRSYIDKEGKLDGSGPYMWVAKVPVEIRYLPAEDNESSRNTQKGVVTAYVKRVPVEVSSRGYVIEAYLFDTSADVSP